MPKNIVVFADGTGQEGGKGADRNTNVYRVFNLLEDRTPRQVAFYDPGLGTGLHKLTGNVAGAGISRNIRQAYGFIQASYEAGDRVFLMGFSRGATTVRSLSGFIHHFGILPKTRPDLVKRAYKIYKTRAPMFKARARRAIRKGELTKRDHLALALDPGDLRHEQEMADKAAAEARRLGASENPAKRRIAAFLKEAADDRTKALEDRLGDDLAYAEELLDKHCDKAADGSYEVRSPRQFMKAVRLEQRARAFIAANHNQWAPVEFLGCYDTVAALGLPLPMLDAILNFIPALQHKFHDLTLSSSVRHARHALAVDDERKVFAPSLWDEPRKEGQTLRQVWFTGMHTDVGGGYRERGLADIALAWMLREAHQFGLLLHPYSKEAIIEDLTDVMHDSRGKWWTGLLYRKKVRSWDRDDHPVVHESVALRAQADMIGVWKKGRPGTAEGKDYQPWILSGKYTVEEWVPFDPRELIALQEDRWQAWTEQLQKKEENRVARAKREWEDAQKARLALSSSAAAL